MKIARTLLAVLLLAVTFAAGPAQQAQAALPAPAQAPTASAEGDVIAHVNSFRASKGLVQLVVSPTLTAAAQWMASDMATRNYFGHVSRDGRTATQRMADSGYPAYQTWSGENLAAGYTSAAEVVQGWIDSPTHHAILVNPAYRAIGVGRAYAAGSTYGWYWAAEFGGIIERSAQAVPESSALAPVAARAPAPPADLGYHAAYAGQSVYPTLRPGETRTLILALKNTGHRGWNSGVVGSQAAIGTSAPQDAMRPDLAWHWVSLNRPATTTTAWVGPGQVGWFVFEVKAPAAAGSYRLSVRAVVEGVTWMEDQGIFWTIDVR